MIPRAPKKDISASPFFSLLLTVPMTESSPKRTLRSSRSTDAETSETPVVDDATQPPPNSSPGEQQQHTTCI